MSKCLYILVILLSFISSQYSFSQDTLLTVDRISIPCKIFEIGEKFVTYRKATLPNGPDFKMPFQRVAVIKYGSGEIVEFNSFLEGSTPKPNAKEVIEEKQPRSKEPATMNPPVETKTNEINKSEGFNRPNKLHENFPYKDDINKNKGSFLLGFGIGLFGQSVDGVSGLRVNPGPLISFELGGIISLGDVISLMPQIGFQFRRQTFEYLVSINTSSSSLGFPLTTSFRVRERQNMIYQTTGFLLGFNLNNKKGKGYTSLVIGPSLDIFISGDYNIQEKNTRSGSGISSGSRISRKGSIEKGVYNYNSLQNSSTQYIVGQDVSFRVGFLSNVSDATTLRLLGGYGLVNTFPGFNNIPFNVTVNEIRAHNLFLKFSVFLRI